MASLWRSPSPASCGKFIPHFGIVVEIYSRFDVGMILFLWSCGGVIVFLRKYTTMAKILFTAFMADARGKLAGTVFSKNAAGSYTRRKVSPSNAQTDAQMSVRSSLAAISSGWRTLSQSQQDAWKAASVNFPRTNVFGATIYLTGHQLYLSLNQNLKLSSDSNVSDPPTPTDVGATDLTLAYTAGALSLTSPTQGQAGGTIMVFATSPQSTGKNNLKNQYRMITTKASGALPPFVITTDYQAKFGTIPVGSKISVKTYIINNTTGQAGVPSFSTIITA